ncbi:MAG: MFS transporter [Acidimicrobiales bacterium]
MASAQPLTAEIARKTGNDAALGQPRGLGGAFWRFWWATGISATGDGLAYVAFPLLALTLTSNPLAIAGVTASSKAFAAFAALPAGVITDRIERRRLMAGCNVAAGVAVAALAAAMTFGAADMAILYVVAGVTAACDVTYTLAAQACTAEVIAHPDQLGTANSRLIGVEASGEQFVGLGVGGLVFSVARRLPFFADAVSFFVSALLIKSITPQPKGGGLHYRAGGGEGSVGVTLAQEPGGATTLPVDGPGLLANSPGHRTNGSSPRANASGHRRPGWGTNLREGVRLFRQQRVLVLLAATVASGTFMQSMFYAVLVLYGRRTLQLSSAGYGGFLALAAALGVIGALSGGRLQKRFGASKLIISGCAFVAISYVGLSFMREAVLAALVFGVQEFGTAMVNVGSVTTRQRLVPRNLYGRVASVHRLMVAGAAPLGAVLGGAVASLTGNVPETILIAGVMEAVALSLVAPPLWRAVARSTPAAPPGRLA